ncbi:unnamed protein product [Ectocarpus sp. CCAP 1310/34]|nr:unnamed protein product [Ectocarpus sp. CCAP 1310/34]
MTRVSACSYGLALQFKLHSKLHLSVGGGAITSPPPHRAGRPGGLVGSLAAC